MCYSLFMEKIAKVTFAGGTGSVTGANFLLEIENKKILVDCGLTQDQPKSFCIDPRSKDG